MTPANENLSPQQLYHLLNMLDDPLIVADERQHVRFANRAARTLTDLTDNPNLTMDALSTNQNFTTQPLLQDKNNRQIYRLQPHPSETKEAKINYTAPPLLKHDDLLRILIHDLSNPLMLALEYAAFLHESQDDSTREAATSLEKYLQQMHKLLENISLLEHAAEDIRASFTPVDLDVLVAVAVNNLAEYGQGHDVKLSITELPEENVTVQGAETLLYQAIYNVIENAIKYTPDGGQVTVSLRSSPPWVDAIVADTGIGIPADEQERVFEPFYRSKNQSITDIRGTGLGLSLVRTITEQHAGQVLLESTPGQGSVFTIRLPQTA